MNIKDLILICLIEYFELWSSDIELCRNPKSNELTCICSPEAWYCLKNLTSLTLYCNLTQSDLFAIKMITTEEISVATTTTATTIIFAPDAPYLSNSGETSKNPSNFTDAFSKAGINLSVGVGVAVILLMLVMGFWIFMCYQTYLKTKRSEREMSYQVLNKNLEGQMIEMKEKYKTIERNVQQVEALVHRASTEKDDYEQIDYSTGRFSVLPIPYATFKPNLNGENVVSEVNNLDEGLQLQPIGDNCRNTSRVAPGTEMMEGNSIDRLI